MNSRSDKWRRRVAEGAVIVVSILLAFGIQAWWEGIGDSGLEDQALETLAAEMDLMEQFFDFADQRDSIVSANAQFLIAAMAMPSERSADSLATATRLLTSWGITETALTAYDLLVNSGSLDIVSNRALAEEVVFLRSVLDAKDSYEGEQVRFVTRELLPYLDQHVDWGMGPRNETWYNQRGVPLASARQFTVDWGPILADRQFSNLVHRRVEWLVLISNIRARIRTSIASVRRLADLDEA